MFTKLKVKYEGVVITFELHEVVYLASQAVQSIQAKTNILAKQQPTPLPTIKPTETDTDEEKFIKEAAAHIVPSSIGPLKEPSEWLGVAREISSLNDQEQIAINVNGKLISIRLADLYSSDYGMIQSIARELFETTFVEPWHEGKYAQAYELIYQKLQEAYSTGTLPEIEKQLQENIIRDFDEDMQKFNFSEDEAYQLKRQIKSMNFVDDFIPHFLQRRQTCARCSDSGYI